MSPLSHQRRTVIALWVTFWLLMISISVEETLRSPVIRWWEPLVWEGSSALVATGWLSLAVRVRTADLDSPRQWFGYYVRWLPVVAVTFTAAVYAIRHGVYAMAGRAYEHPSWRFLLVYESIKVVLFAGLWLGILFGLDAHGKWRAQRDRLLQTQKALAEAQLAQLQGQLRPHFLFNALNTVSALMQTDVARADRLIATLGDLLRASLRTTDNQTTSLDEELRALELYTNIMRERFRDRVTLDLLVDRTLADSEVPALMLQPLVENVFKHAVERVVTPIHIDIRVQRVGASVDIVVANSGPYLSASHHDGVGLRNCRERLRILYGDTASLVLRNKEDGVCAHLSLPLTSTVA